MDTRLLKHFLSLADLLHFGRAAEACHLSPSALSRSIKQLEDELGVTLFERDNRSVSLTHEGQLFINYARDTLLQWDEIRHSLQQEAQELHGEVSMYCSVTASYSFLYELLSEFRRTYPKVEIKVHTGDPDLAINRVLSGAEDIAIAAYPQSLPGVLAFKPIARSPLLFIGPRQHHDWQQLAEAPASAENWQHLPMIIPEVGLGREWINAWFYQLGCSPNIYAQVAGNEAIVSMVSLGFGIGVVPRIVLDNSPLQEEVRILAVEPALPAYDVGLFTLNKKLKNPLINAFWQQISARFPQ
ncbi:HTH-type transcriptional activator IlvY [Balneatrix alpica]|uniref:HTH-type transcriptional activator IlvY n=1 Tax=Balneatrix alpica TaxID=75684 RepID=UPI00273823D7|nr:HTH-type transcriptional activator IlvY [Balneatrix alpica]